MLLNTPICDFGWKAPGFTLKDPYGQTFSLSEIMGEKGLMIVFMCNHCPYVKAVISRLVGDAKKLQKSGINFLGVMSNDYKSYPDDAPEKMKEFIEIHGMEFPYVIDEDQIVARTYGAVCTPDFFGFNNRYELQYRGRLDNAGLDQPENRIAELYDAMISVAETGKGPKEQTPSMGCSIKWRR